MPLARIDSTKGLVIDNQSGSTGNIVPPTGTSSQLTAGDGTAVTVGTGLSLTGATLNNGGNLPAVGDYTWVLAGASPFSNQGTAGAAQATGALVSSASSQGLWSSGRTAFRGYVPSTDALLSASNTFSAAWQNTSFTLEAYFQLDYATGPIGGNNYSLVFNDFGVGSNAVYVTSPGSGSSLSTSLQLFRGGSMFTSVGVGSSIMLRPIHLAFVLDRTTPSAVAMSLYVDGFQVVSSNLGTFAAFTTPFSQFNVGLGYTGVVGWASLTSSAKTAAQIRDNTLLLKAA